MASTSRKSGGGGSTSKKRRGANARFATARLPTAGEAWQAVRARLTPASHPSTTSESAIDSSFNHTDLFHLESEPKDKSSRRTVQLLNPNAGTASKFKPRPSVRKAKSSAANSTSRYGDDDEPGPGSGAVHDPISHIVVDNDFEQFTPQAAKSESGSTTRTPGAGTKGETGTGAGSDEEDGTPYTPSDGASISRGNRGWARRNPAYELVVERIWPNLAHFLDSSFPEPAKERSFQKETWFMNKQGAMMSGLYFLIAWILTCSLLPQPLSTFSVVTYVVIGGVFTAPLLFLIIFDLPRRAGWIYQPFLAGATWVFADILLIEMRTCGFYAIDNQCGSRSFIYLFGWALGQPVLAVFAMKQARPWAIVGAVQWLVLACSLLMTEPLYPTLFYRNLVTFSLFQAFIIMTSFMKERSDRQMFALRQQLKIQYRATQSAQVMERRAGDSKKRFVSYIFHEVRVPLNTALLAVQNLEGENVFKGLEEDQKEMVHGLMGSLTMMEKVLNDVLSFNRMESGKFAQARRAFEFHKSIQLVALSHRSQAQMAGIALDIDLDSAIDRIGGVFLGDEMRLRQVTSNLVSNSIKFTESGSVKIVTKLLYPRMEPTPGEEIDDPLRIARVNAEKQAHIQVINGGEQEKRTDGEEKEKEATLAGTGQSGHSSTNASGTWGSGDLEKAMQLPTLPSTQTQGSAQHDPSGRRSSRDSVREQRERDERNRYKAVVRVEVHDTGVGLRKQDVVDNRLFSPYVQTEIGRRQGGKGSGLGLALVRQIVKLSHGRLGVESTFGKGTCIWFELPYSLPRNKGTGGSTQPPPVHPHDFGTDPNQPDLQNPAPYPTFQPYPPTMPRWYSYQHPRRDSRPDQEAHEGDVSRSTATTAATEADTPDGKANRERPSVMTTDSSRPLLQSSMSTIGTGVQLQQYQHQQLQHQQSYGFGNQVQPGGMGVPMDSRGGVELDGIQAAVFPAVRGLSDASAASAASSASVGFGENASAGPSGSIASLRESTGSEALSPEVVVIDKRDPFLVASPPALPAQLPPASAWSSAGAHASGSSRERRSSEWRRDIGVPSTLSRVDDATAEGEAGAQVQTQQPVSPKTPRDASLPSQAEVQARAQAAGVDDDERPLCTLVVDDDKLTRMLMSRMLTRLGHQVTTAENGKIALDLINDSYERKEAAPAYDVVFLDNQMPLMSGVEVASHVRDSGNHIFIVGCTGNALREDQDEYIAAGADGIIPKPIHQKAVLDMIKQARRRIKGETSWSPPDESRRG